MKELNIFIQNSDLSKVTDILQKYPIGLTFFEVEGTGRTPRFTPEVVHSYQTGRKTIPKFVGKILIISVIPDSLSQKITDEILSIFMEQKEPCGVLFVKQVDNAYELGTNLIDDQVLYL